MLDLLKPDLFALIRQLKRPSTFLYLLSGIFWIAGLYFPSAGVLFYLFLIYPAVRLIQRKLQSEDIFFLLLPYFLTIGAGVWHSVIPFGLGIPLSFLLCGLIRKLFYLFLAPHRTSGSLQFLLLPAFLALLDAVFQKIPGLSSMEMIPVLSPIYHHTPLLAPAAFVGRHITFFLILSAVTAIGLLVVSGVSSAMQIPVVERKRILAIAVICSTLMAGSNLAASVDTDSEAPRISVTAVQASLGTREIPDGLQGEDLLQFRFERYVETAGNPDTDIVLFPEIMVGIYDTAGIVDTAYRERWINQAKEWNCILLPTVLEGDSRTQSVQDRHITTLVVDPSGILGRSSKRNLVPFSESRRYRPGADYMPIPTPLGDIGLSICFDANTDTIQKLARNNAQIILAPFNDTGFSPAFYRVHRFYTIIQAVEFAIPVVVANESGLSQIIDSRGRIIDDLPLASVGVVSAQVPLSRSPSFYLQYGHLVEFLFLVFILALQKRSPVPGP